MTRATPPDEGLPGTTSAVHLALRSDLTITEWARALRLLGHMAHGLSFWLADALIFGEEHYGEKMAQFAEETGLAPKTILNLVWVGRAWAPKQRREGLEFGHHAVLAALDAEDREHWANLTEAGDPLPNGEKRRWSVSRLRQELRALTPATAAPTTVAVTVPASSNPDDGMLLSCGDLIVASGTLGLFRIVAMSPVPGGLVVRAEGPVEG